MSAAWARDTERLRWFETEARAAGQLNHPNILSVYDFSVQEGMPYLVTELLEGESLRERLTAGASGTSAVALPARKAVEIAMQVARGLRRRTRAARRSRYGTSRVTFYVVTGIH